MVSNRIKIISPINAAKDTMLGYMSFLDIPLDYETLKIVSNIFIAFIGSGVLGLPYAFKRSGLLEGAFVMAIVAYFSTRAMLLLIDCKYKVKSVLQDGASTKTNGTNSIGTPKDTSVVQNGVDAKPNGFGEVFTGVTINGDNKEDVIRLRENVTEKDTSLQDSEDEEHPFVSPQYYGCCISKKQKVL